ncbi:hypothetical protein LTR84_005450 [Exophiala bonariae]|uniref:Uncharacterized protein n=1 Tax=Exophiala bonariae TaxID=1690606 RepID=A0AAV9N3W2_9EURO|nr:hypothetical protein LTR84_005450 [Exophiala bonariae]
MPFRRTPANVLLPGTPQFTIVGPEYIMAHGDPEDNILKRLSRAINKPLRKPITKIRNGYRRLQDWSATQAPFHLDLECNCRTCRSGNQARARIQDQLREEMAEVLPDVPPPPYVDADPVPPRLTRDRTNPGSNTRELQLRGAAQDFQQLEISGVREALNIMDSVVEEARRELRNLREEIGEERERLAALKRQKLALDASISMSRLEWNQELARSQGASERLVHGRPSRHQENKSSPRHGQERQIRSPARPSLQTRHVQSPLRRRDREHAIRPLENHRPRVNVSPQVRSKPFILTPALRRRQSRVADNLALLTNSGTLL